MMEKELLCKILFQDSIMKTPLWIVGIVNREQLFSTFNSFIEIRNYGNEVIGKEDIEHFIIYKGPEEIVITKTTLAVFELKEIARSNVFSLNKIKIIILYD